MDFLAVAALLDPAGSGTWSNLGFWEDAAVPYPAAARELALRLGRDALLGPGQDVLDVGIGAGDPLCVWRDAFEVRSVCGVEKDPACVAAARRRTAHDPAIDVRRGTDADLLQLPAGAFDRVLALDCAYHFGDRARFAAAAFERLRPSGRIAWTDLALADGHRAPRGLAGAFGVEGRHLLDRPGLAATLEHAGFDGVTVEDWTDPVLGGFARHVRTHLGRLLRPSAASVAVLATAVAAGALRGRVRYVRVRARRPDPGLDADRDGVSESGLPARPRALQRDESLRKDPMQACSN